MPLPEQFAGRLALPVIASPMFIVSMPELVIAQCNAGIIGTMPSLNARHAAEFEPMLVRIRQETEAYATAHPGQKVAPFGVNLIVHKTNKRVEHDLEVCVRQRVPLIITSLGASAEIVRRVRDYGGLVFHDVTNMRHARKAIGEGVDGLIPVCAGAGGHAGALSPIALMRELREIWSGAIALSGAISDGAGILAALALGADFAYIGSRFIATAEAAAKPEYKQMLVDSAAEDVMYTSAVSGVPANYLRPSIVRAGLDPDNMGERDKSTMDFGSGDAKAWRDIWGCGHGIGIIHDLPSTAELVRRLRAQFAAARQDLLARSAGFAALPLAAE